MKRISGILAFVIFISSISLTSSVSAQSDVVTAKIKVDGNCSMCKKRIEEAAYTNGVKRAEWDQQTDTLTVSYRSDKVAVLDIEKKIAAAGHDTEHVKAGDAQYKKLATCCAYRGHAGHDH